MAQLPVRLPLRTYRGAMKYETIQPYMQHFQNNTARVPMTFQATAVRYAARAGGVDLGTSYLEVSRPAEGIRFRLIWMTEHTLGVLTGTSPDQRWSGDQSIAAESDHSIVGQIHPLSAVQSVSFADPPVGYDDFAKEISVVGGITLHLRDADDIEIGNEHLTSPELRDRREAVINAVLGALGRF